MPRIEICHLITPNIMDKINVVNSYRALCAMEHFVGETMTDNMYNPPVNVNIRKRQQLNFTYLMMGLYGTSF